MPLHLLGKKSWNVYNQDSIGRVRRDEAAAELHEKKEQRRIDEADAESRLRVLRGVRDGTCTGNQLADVEEKHDQTQRPKKKRRLEGEDDTERGERLSTSRWQEDIPLIDQHGHVSLIPESDARKAERSVELATESKKRQQEFEDQYTMRFANAAGKNAAPGGPWYNEPVRKGSSTTVVPKNVWGNDDPRRREREKKRTDANDPLAMIKKGVRQLREAEKHREDWRAQRERDLNEVEELAEKHKHHRKRRQSDEDSLDRFNLDEDHKGLESVDKRNRKDSSERHRQRRKHGSVSHRHNGGRH